MPVLLEILDKCSLIRMLKKTEEVLMVQRMKRLKQIPQNIFGLPPRQQAKLRLKGRALRGEKILTKRMRRKKIGKLGRKELRPGTGLPRGVVAAEPRIEETAVAEKMKIWRSGSSRLGYSVRVRCDILVSPTGGGHLASQSAVV